MLYEPWMLTALDETGYNGIRDEHIEVVKQELLRFDQANITKAIFETACRRSGINPGSFTQADLNRLQEKLNE